MIEQFEVVTTGSGVTTLSCDFGAAKVLMETGRLARQASSIVAQVGGTVVMANVVRATEPKPGQGFFPLMVDYREKFYAAGRIPGGFFKREARPSTGETLRARLLDRPIRPLFPEGFMNEVQVYITVMSYDGQNPAEMVALNAASAALSMSDIPFSGPIGGVRVGYTDEKFILNPTVEEMANSQLDLVVAGTMGAIMMVESGANELDEKTMLAALEFAHENIKGLCRAQAALVAKVGKPKSAFKAQEPDAALLKKLKAAAKKPIAAIMAIKGKLEREDAISAAAKEMAEKLVDVTASDASAQKSAVKELFNKEVDLVVREQVLAKGIRNDGRKLDELRQITCEVGVLPRTHGTGLFTRGETQALNVLTLGTVEDEQMIDSLYGLSYQRFYLHYNFPSYSVGECRPPRGPGRREIGHGALAERALLPVLPPQETCPYTIRLVSEVLESNGSSSMATVCSGTLALMDGGVKISRPVAGIAMGLILEGEKFAILSDISGSEDHLGDMDFKVAGTERGITALQMDIKVEGISTAIMSKALAQALEGRRQILAKMAETIAESREDYSTFAPRIVSIKINPDKIREIIGPGGKTINAIQEETGAKINIEQDGTVTIASPDSGSVAEAVRRIEAITAEAEVGRVYHGKVVNITNFGCFVEILPGKDGLVHISELALSRINRVEDVCKLGDEMDVKCIGVDDSGRVRLSRKALLEGGDGGGGGGGREDRGPRDDRGGREGGSRDGGREGGGRERGRGGRYERDERVEGSDRGAERAPERAPDRGGERSERPDRGGDRFERGGDRPERSERGDRPERSDRGERPARSGERAGRPDRGERTERPERFERPSRPAADDDRRGPARPRREEPAAARPDDDDDAPYYRGVSKGFAPDADEDEEETPVAARPPIAESDDDDDDEGGDDAGGKYDFDDDFDEEIDDLPAEMGSSGAPAGPRSAAAGDQDQGAGGRRRRRRRGGRGGGPGR